MIPSITKLHIDAEFQRLIPTLTDEEYGTLEQSLLRDGCRDPICVWTGIILDGHNRYEICNRLGLNYATVNIHLPNRDAAIAWICMTQIGRRNITEEMRKYLIGKRYEAEKRLGSPNKSGANQHSIKDDPILCAHPKVKKHRHRTAISIGREYQVCPTTIQQYGSYAAAMDGIANHEKELAARMLTGQVKVSMACALQLSKMPAPAFSAVCSELKNHIEEGLQYSESRKILESHVKKPPKKTWPSVKDMPSYDPDAEISSLALTIPSWMNSINRIRDLKNLKDTSTVARHQLTNELHRLVRTIDDLLVIMKENRR